METGLGRFRYFLDKLEHLLQDAALSDDPATYVYLNDGRGLLFKLEALARVYAELHNPNRFSKLTARFKMLEDLLGDADHYDAFFRKTQQSNLQYADYFFKHYQEAISSLNQVLSEDDWLNGKRIKKIRKKLENADWLTPELEKKAVERFYKDTIREVREFYNECEHPFRDMEEEVHELRRDLRWLSIYPHSMRGMFRLTEAGPVEPGLQKYMDPQILNSPFLRFPESTQEAILIRREHFVALSWMIDKLGRIKDEGLEIFAMKEVGENKIPENFFLNEDEPGFSGLRELLNEATNVCGDYFGLKSPEKLPAH